MGALNTLASVNVHLFTDTVKRLPKHLMKVPMHAWEDHTCLLALPLISWFPLAQPQPRSSWCQAVPLKKGASAEYPGSIGGAKLILQGATIRQLRDTCPVKCAETGSDLQNVKSLSNGRHIVRHDNRTTHVTCADGPILQPATTSYEMGALAVDNQHGCILSLLLVIFLVNMVHVDP